MVATTPMPWATTWAPMLVLPSPKPVPPRDSAREHAGEHGADDAADAVDAEHVERVVVAQARLSLVAKTKQTMPEARPRTMAPIGPTEPQAGVMATRPATAPEAMPSTLGLPWAIHSQSIQAHGGRGGGELGHEHGHARDVVRGELGAGVEAEPAHPQHAGADHGVAEVVRRHRRRGIALALAEHDAGRQAGDAGVDVHHGAAGEVEDAEAAEPAAAPDPVADRRVAQR